jgi:hypothetical protein
MRSAIFSLIAVALLSSGCGEQKKIKECNEFIAVINRGVEKVQKGTSGAPDGGGGAAVAELRTLADEMDVITKEAAAIAVTMPELKKLAGDYQAMVTEVSGAARDLATAVDNVDMEKMSAAQSRMDSAVKREDPLIEQLNKFCKAP